MRLRWPVVGSIAVVLFCLGNAWLAPALFNSEDARTGYAVISGSVFGGSVALLCTWVADR